MHASLFLGFRKGFVVGLCGIGLLGSAAIANAAGWVALTSPVSGDMYGMDCAGGDCIQVGANGAVIRSSDYVTWTVGSSGVSTTLLNVDMQSDTTAIAVGTGGTIIKTTDGGATWSSITGITTEDIYGVSYASATVAYLAAQDGHVFKTTDGGATWSDVGASLSGLDAFTIDAFNASVVYVAGKYGGAFKSTDGGTTWSPLATMTSEHIYAIDAVSASVAFIGGANRTIAKTTNGSSFTLQTLPDFGTTETVTDLSCTSSSLCLLSGNEGVVQITGNGGTTWTKETMPSTAVLGGVANVAVGKRFVGGNGGALFSLDNYGPNDIEDFALVAGGTSTTDTTPALSWTAATDDESSVVSYEIDINGAGTWDDIGNVTEYTLVSALSAGDHTVRLRAVDEVDNVSSEAELTFTVTVVAADTTAPSVGSISPLSATQNTPVTLSATVTDASGIQDCRLYVNGSDQGAMTATAPTYSRSYTPATGASFTAYASCGDTAGNLGTGATVTVAVTAAVVTSTDTVAPTVGAIAQTSATAGTARTLTASVADSGGMGSCVLYVNSVNVGSMTISGGYASRSYTFEDAGDVVANAYCTDAAGNSTRGASTTIEVAAAEGEESVVGEAELGSLIKLACDSDSTVEDPCRAVYYYDGKRHAFPNEKVFFTWYDDFDDVVIVTDDYMASITLGRNVTYRPGSRMVKFVTVNTVYGVGTDGELRAIASEDVAESIWGSAWNTLIDDISDAFFGNYRFGEDIDSTSDFDPDEVKDSVTDIADIFDEE
jgi:photosystem II stability/assembly factor-like uncharacterized protein